MKQFKCDVKGCNTTIPIDNMDFISAGWRRVAGKDLCPKHAGEYKQMMAGIDDAKAAVSKALFEGLLEVKSC